MRSILKRRWAALAIGSALTLLIGATGIAGASPPASADGTITQTELLSIDVSFAGPNVIIEQTVSETLSGTLTGTAVEDIRAVLHPNGKLTATGTGTCECTVEGIGSGVLEWTAATTGEVPFFEGRIVITGGTGDLSGVSGVLEFAGIVDVATSLSMSQYSGGVHAHP
jgi:hypothetical protein